MFDLKNNPFYILEVSPQDNRSTITAKTEEKSFFVEDGCCETAQATLLNPSKRLQAELDWFLDVDNTIIFNCITDNKEIRVDALSHISKINMLLHNLNIMQNIHVYDLGAIIVAVDEQFSLLSTNSIIDLINNLRKKAGIRATSAQEVYEAIGEKRESIRHLFAHHLKKIPDKEYIQFVLLLSKKYISDVEYDYGVIISDIIDQYEIRMQNSIDEASEDILSHIKRIQELNEELAVKDSLKELTNRIKKWSSLVQPLQYISMRSGVQHPNSEKIGVEIRNLALYLHNEKSYTKLSLSLVDSMIEVFKELPVLFDLFSQDSKALIEILNRDKILEDIVADFDSVERIIKKWKMPDTSSGPYTIASNAINKDNVSFFIAKIKALHQKIKTCKGVDQEIIFNLRERLCYIAREAAIYMHNERHQTFFAHTIAEALFEEFKDIAEIKTQLSEDIASLNRQMLSQTSISSPTYMDSQSSSSRNWGCIIVVAIFLLIAIIAGVSQCDSGTKEEYIFSQSAEAYDDVYIDIVSIEPVVGIHTAGAYTNTDVACKCKTSDGKITWVYMSVYEYNKYIDSSAQISNSFYSNYEVKYFSSARRIHGTARKAESLCDGLASDTSTMILYFKSID